MIIINLARYYGKKKEASRPPFIYKYMLYKAMRDLQSSGACFETYQ